MYENQEQKLRSVEAGAEAGADAREGMRARLRAAITDKLVYAVGKDTAHASMHDWYLATALAVPTGLSTAGGNRARETYRRREAGLRLSSNILIRRNFRDSVRQVSD